MLLNVSQANLPEAQAYFEGFVSSAARAPALEQYVHDGPATRNTFVRGTGVACASVVQEHSASHHSYGQDFCFLIAFTAIGGVRAWLQC